MIKNLFKRKKNKVVVIGIDGVPCTMLKGFVEEGLMPNLGKLAGKGTLTDMTASIPEVSSTSWSTFMTGVNPGKHGIYGFTELQNGSYKWKFPNFNDLQSKTLWEIAGENGLRSVVLNVPSTYPAKELRGVLTSGFVSLDLKKATYPESVYEYLKDIQYKMDVDTRKAQESSEALADEIKSAFEVRKKAFLHLYDSEDWDLFVGVITETDRLHHYLWIALQDKNHPQHEFFIYFYRKLDDFIGEIYERTGDDIPFVILSDHGFATIKKEIYLNSWLREQGYLKFNKDNPGSFEDMSSESKVFVLDPSRFYIHSKDKYPNGNVDINEYNTLREDLKKNLLSLEIDGVKIIKKIMFKEELYSGEFIKHAPDLVALSYEGYDLKGSINKNQIAGTGFLTGGHTRENAVFFINRKVSNNNINIIDVGPTIISLLNISYDKFDGKSIV